MPYNWVRIRSSPPRERRDSVRGICAANGGRLCEEQIFYDERGKAWALVEVPTDQAQREALLGALDAVKWTGVVDADEKADGKVPPPSKLEADDDSEDEVEIEVEEIDVEIEGEQGPEAS